jgi:hypothetical protein
MQYANLIHAFCLKDPKLVLSNLVPFISEKVLKKRKNINNEEL